VFALLRTQASGEGTALIGVPVSGERSLAERLWRQEVGERYGSLAAIAEEGHYVGCSESLARQLREVPLDYIGQSLPSAFEPSVLFHPGTEFTPDRRQRGGESRRTSRQVHMSYRSRR
jgi:hypothetical protein